MSNHHYGALWGTCFRFQLNTLTYLQIVQDNLAELYHLDDKTCDRGVMLIKLQTKLRHLKQVRCGLKYMHCNGIAHR